MIINKEGKLFGKISIVDILVILAIAVAALGIYSRFFVGNEKVETASSHIEYTMKIDDVRIGTVKALEKLGPITNATTKEAMGNLVSVSCEDAIKAVETIDGTIKNSPLPERYDVTITVRVDGSVNSSGFYTGSNQPLTIGSNYVFTSKYAKTTGKILSIKEIQ